MRAHEIIRELAYPGNIGIMELTKFFGIATPEQKALFKQLKAAGKTNAAWKLMQKVVGVKLHNTESINLIFNKTPLSESELVKHLKEKHNRNCDNTAITNFTPGSYKSGLKRYINESLDDPAILEFLNKLYKIEVAKRIKIGDMFSVIDCDVGFAWKEINVSGFTTPKRVAKINCHTDNTINYIMFEDGSTHPRQKLVTFNNAPTEHSFYFNTASSAKKVLTYISLILPSEWSLNFDLTESTKIAEGGWASTKTQNTVITPQFVANVRVILSQFEKEFNSYLQSQNLPPIGIGHPVGSGTYYERDLKINPTREYGDIDVSFYIPRMAGMNNNQATQLFANNVKAFCDAHPEKYDTSNGKNVIVQVGADDYVQVDLVTSYSDMKEWGAVLAPEYNVKGVLCASLLSALAETLSLSIGAHGVQAKTLNGTLVKFTTIKGTELHTVSTSKSNWAVDIVKFLGGTHISPLLQQYPGLKDEVRVADMINSIKGIMQSLGRDELIDQVKRSYLEKINKVATSSKFDKAETPAAIEKAQHTKEMLTSKSVEIAALFDK